VPAAAAAGQSPRLASGRGSGRGRQDRASAYARLAISAMMSKITVAAAIAVISAWS
jgi:hypothetical protein